MYVSPPRVLDEEKEQHLIKIVAADNDFNKDFKLDDVRQYDLLLLSSFELDLGQATSLKEKVNTIEDLLYYAELNHVTLALVVEGLRSTSFDRFDIYPHLVVMVDENKRSFIER
jgi:hypothetical protein